MGKCIPMNPIWVMMMVLNDSVFVFFFGKQKQLVGNTDTLDESASTNPSGIG